MKLTNFCTLLVILGIPRIGLAEELSARAYPGAAWSPIVVGALIGVLSCATRYFSQKPIGASSAYAKVAGLLGVSINRDHTLSLKYFKDNRPAWSWELLFVLFAAVGGLIAAAHGNELELKFSPQMWVDRLGEANFLRFVTAFVGGAFLAIGARIAGGCTSGHGISGTQEMSIGSWISLLCFFIGGAVVAGFLLN